MLKKKRHICHAMGSVMDIAPSTDYMQYVPNDPIERRIQRHFEKTGNSIKVAIDRLAAGHGKKSSYPGA